MVIENKKTHRRWLLKNFLITFFSLISVLLILNLTLSVKSKKIFLRSFEKKSLSKLDIYHEGIIKITEEKINDKLLAIVRLSKSTKLISALDSNFKSEIAYYLNEYEDEFFDNLLVLDNQGHILHLLKSQDVSGNVVVGSDLSQREYFKNTSLTKRPYVSDVFYSITGYYNIVFSAPILNQNGQVKYVVVGSKRLKNMMTDFTFNTNFDYFYSILIDKKGYLITDGKNSIIAKQDLTKEQPFIAEFIKSPKEKFGEAVDRYGNKLYVKGSVLKFNEGSSFYLISFYPLTEYEKEISSIKEELNNGFYISVVIAFVLFFFCWYLIFDYFKKNSKHINNV